MRASQTRSLMIILATGPLRPVVSAAVRGWAGHECGLQAASAGRDPQPPPLQHIVTCTWDSHSLLRKRYTAYLLRVLVHGSMVQQQPREAP